MLLHASLAVGITGECIRAGTLTTETRTRDLGFTYLDWVDGPEVWKSQATVVEIFLIQAARGALACMLALGPLLNPDMREGCQHNMAVGVRQRIAFGPHFAFKALISALHRRAAPDRAIFTARCA
jgi:hypothetical protein